MTPLQADRLTDSDHWFRISMPYTFQKLETPASKHLYLPLNRNYKPLGIRSKDHVDYESFRDSHAVLFSSDPRKFQRVWSNSKLYLYYDNPESRRTYFERLDRLMSKSIKLS